MVKYIFTIAFLFFSSVAFLQNSLNDVLKAIEQNNKSIQSAEQQQETRELTLHTGLTPENPFISVDYMVGQPESAGNQFDLLAAQRFDFPSSYKHKKEFANRESKSLQFQVENHKRDVLLQAKLICIELIYLNRKKEVLQQRILYSDSTLKDFQLKYELEQISVLDLNKAKIKLLEFKATMQELENNIEVKLQSLTQLNGGQSVSFSQLKYPIVDSAVDYETIRDSFERNDPYLSFLKQKEFAQQAQLKLSKSMALPKIEAGYRYQFVLGQTFNGGHLGLSIPLWQHKNTIKANKSKVQLNQFLIQEHKTEHHYQINSLFKKQLSLANTIKEYNSILESINTETVLREHLELGEIDFITFILELEYFYKARDKLMLLEMEYQQLWAQINKYKL